MKKYIGVVFLVGAMVFFAWNLNGWLAYKERTKAARAAWITRIEEDTRKQQLAESGLLDLQAACEERIPQNAQIICTLRVAVPGGGCRNPHLSGWRHTPSVPDVRPSVSVFLACEGTRGFSGYESEREGTEIALVTLVQDISHPRPAPIVTAAVEEQQ